ncbi:MAG: hypothetical protein ACREN1_06655 [Candidatus Dormibacteria bacterium]
MPRPPRPDKRIALFGPDGTPADFPPGIIPDGLQIIVLGRPSDPAALIRSVIDRIPEAACFEVIIFLAADGNESYAFAVSLQAALAPLKRDMRDGRHATSHLTVGLAPVHRRSDERTQIRIFPLDEPPPLNRRERRRRGVHRGH